MTSHKIDLDFQKLEKFLCLLFGIFLQTYAITFADSQK